MLKLIIILLLAFNFSYAFLNKKECENIYKYASSMEKGSYHRLNKNEKIDLDKAHKEYLYLTKRCSDKYIQKKAKEKVVDLRNLNWIYQKPIMRNILKISKSNNYDFYRFSNKNSEIDFVYSTSDLNYPIYITNTLYLVIKVSNVDDFKPSFLDLRIKKKGNKYYDTRLSLKNEKYFEYEKKGKYYIATYKIPITMNKELKNFLDDVKNTKDYIQIRYYDKYNKLHTEYFSTKRFGITATKFFNEINN